MWLTYVHEKTPCKSKDFCQQCSSLLEGALYIISWNCFRLYFFSKIIFHVTGYAGSTHVDSE